MEPIELYKYVFFKIISKFVYLCGIDLKLKKNYLLAYFVIFYVIIFILSLFYTIIVYDFVTKLQSIGIVGLAIQVRLCCTYKLL